MTLTVDVVDDLAAVPAAQWDAVVDAAAAPIFYRRTFLDAYARHPLQDVSLSYLVVAERGAPAALVPCQLYERPDPLGTLAALLPDGSSSALLTHVLHCYDTRVPACRAGPAVDLACEAMARHAGQRGARWFGFANVASDGELAAALRNRGLTERAMTERYQLELGGKTVEDALAGVASRHRLELLRHVRRAADAGVRTDVCDVTDVSIEELARLLADLAGRHDAATYYPPERLVPFLRALGDCVQVIDIRSGDRMLAGGVCFVHGKTFHMWAAGARYGETPFSPYYVLVYESIRAAVASGATLAEGGRGNGEFKRRHGFRAVPLAGFIGRAA